VTTTIDPKSAPADVAAWLAHARPLIEQELTRRLATPKDIVDGDPVGRLYSAMRYGALGPGKRLRPALVLAACEACGGRQQDALPAAAALELLHAYTLVHDDLPAMDDDDERRGRATVHIEFDEATAVLAGDGLLTAAFGSLVDLPTASQTAAALGVLSARAGGAELLGGQALDLAAESGDAQLSFEALERVHEGKTGALFAAAAELGGIAGGADREARDKLARYGMAIGIAFQHADDRDDEQFGEHAKRASARMAELCSEAEQLATSFGERGATLVAVAQWIRGVS
jgi:geranylgeranyl pyrophosphate synthase